MSFVPCELHCHTIHSDGNFTPRELQLSAKENGLSLIALTDHNTFSGYEEIDNNIIKTIKGIEWTTYFGHMLVLGAKSFVDWRDATDDNIDEKVAQVRKNGGLVGVAHPFQLGSPMCTGGRWDFKVQKWENVNYIEIWHESFSENNYENDKATAFWKSLLDKGYKLACTYGRDWHREEKTKNYGCTYLDIPGKINPENALDAIKKGRTVASTGANFSFKAKQNEKIFSLGDSLSEGEALLQFSLDMNARKNYHTDNTFEYEKIKIISNRNECVKETDVTEDEVMIYLQKNRWYIAELWGKMSGKAKPLAITSPIYTK